MSLIPNLIAQDGNAECASLQVGWGSHQDSVGRTAIYSVGNSIYGAMELVGDVFKSFLDEKWGLVPSWPFCCETTCWHRGERKMAERVGYHLRIEFEVFRLKCHWCCWLNFGTLLTYETPAIFWVKLTTKQWLTNIIWAEVYPSTMTSLHFCTEDGVSVAKGYSLTCQNTLALQLGWWVK